MVRKLCRTPFQIDHGHNKIIFTGHFWMAEKMQNTILMAHYCQEKNAIFTFFSMTGKLPVEHQLG